MALTIKQGGGRPAGGGYYVTREDGKRVRVPSVTTITGRFKDSTGLIRWAYAQGQRKERGEIDDLYDERDKAGDIGSKVHDLVEAIISGADADEAIEAHSNDPHVEQITSGVRAFLSWWRGSSLEVIETETPLVSEKHEFAGTFDAIARREDGALVLLDWKTSNGIYPEYVVQLGAYALLLAERGDKVSESHLCRFSKEFGSFSQHHLTAEMLRVGAEQFLRLRAAYSADQLLGRMVR